MYEVNIIIIHHHYEDEKIKAQRVYITCPGSDKYSHTKNPGSLTMESMPLTICHSISQKMYVE